MTSAPNPTPAYRLGVGTEVAGYRLLRRVGRGWESTSYLAFEKATGALRRLKFYRDTEPEHLVLTAAAFARLHATDIVPPCYEMGSWWRNGREEIRFLVFGYVEGKPLTTVLQQRRWRRPWRPETAVNVLWRMATKVAAVHNLGRAVGDFHRGSNILLRPDGDIVWCDLDPGSPNEPNEWIEGDRDHFFTVVDLLAAHHPASHAIRRAEKVLSRFRNSEVTWTTFGCISRALDPPTNAQSWLDVEDDAERRNDRHV